MAIILVLIAALVFFSYKRKSNTLQNIQALSETKDPAGIDQLVSRLNNSDPKIQHSAAYTLQEYGELYLGLVLASIIKNQRNIIRATTTPKRPIDINVLASQNASAPSTRTVTVDLGSSAIGSLIPLLGSDNDALKNTVKRVLLQFGSVAVEPLIAALDSPDKTVRVNALYLLGEIRDIRAANIIMDNIKDNDVDIRNAAAAAIKGFNITAIPKESETVREIINREIVKIPCRYCGSLVEVTAMKCPSCGAPFKL